MSTLELDLTTAVDGSGSTLDSTDLRFLNTSKRPDYDIGVRPVRIVDLFCGCGGLTLGLAEAARRMQRRVDVRLAVDLDERAVNVFKANFPRAQVQCDAVEFFFDGKVGQSLTDKELGVRDAVGSVHSLVGGPPCQGHSDLNNHTRREDRRNSLYVLMARAAEVLQPEVVLIENVQAVARDRGQVVQETEKVLQAAGYCVSTVLLDLGRLGVPQRRRRHFLLATKQGLPTPTMIFQHMISINKEYRTVRWAIGDLAQHRNGDPLHVASEISPDNQRRIAWLHEHGEYDLPNHQRPVCHRNKNHTYKSVYGRLRWDQPAQTITTGFSSMGQGRYVHPSRRRTLTPREAARLQFFPDFFDFAVINERTIWNEMIGNAVPPKLTMVLGAILIPHLY